MFGVPSRAVAVLAALVASVALLSGCVGSDPKPTPTPTPKATPLYSSDAEALAAAKESYQRYLDVLNRVANDGWTQTSPLREVENSTALERDQEDASSNRARGWRSTGAVVFRKMKIQSIDVSAVTAYLCLDLSSTRVIGADGSDVTSPGRTEVIPVVSRFTVHNKSLIVSKNDKWNGNTFCS